MDNYIWVCYTYSNEKCAETSVNEVKILDKYEYRIKADQIKKLVEKEDYSTAMKIADSIDWNRVRNVSMLCTVSDIYEKNEKYEESREILLLAYERAPVGRTIVYQLAELSIKLEDYDEAVAYYKEYEKIAPNDSNLFILKYKIYKGKGGSLETLISILEEFKHRDYHEEWAYELAYLYHQAGLAEKCIEECNEIDLWFGEGTFVTKALELKMLYQPLTPEQEIKYENRFQTQKKEQEESEKVIEEVDLEKQDDFDIQIKPVNVSRYDTLNLQKELAKGMQQLFEATEKETVDSTMQNIKKLVEESNIPELSMTQQLKKIGEGVHDSVHVELRKAAQEPYVFLEQNIMEEKGDNSNTKESYEEILTEEQDGQICLEVPDDNILEKQITGQMTIEDVLNEWEKTKAAAEEAIAQREQEIFEEAKATAIRETESIMDRLTDVLPKITEEMLQNAKKEEEPEEIEEELDEEPEQTLFSEEDDDAAEQLEKEIEQALPKGIEALAETVKPVIKETPKAVHMERDLQSEIAGAVNTLEDDIRKAATKEIFGKTREFVPLSGHKKQEKKEEPEIVPVKQADVKIEPVAEEEKKQENPLDDMPETMRNLEELLLKSMNASDAAKQEAAVSKEPEQEPLKEEVEEGLEEELTEALPEEETAEPDEDLEEKSEEEPEESEEEIQEKPEESEEEEIQEEPEESEEETAKEPEESAEEEPAKEQEEDAGEEPDEAAEEEPDENGFTNEQKSMFAYFLNFRGVKEKLSELVQMEEETPSCILVTGRDGSGRTSLTMRIIKVLQKKENKKGGKVAKISGVSLNKKNIESTMEKIANGVLIVEHAGGLNKKTLEELDKILTSGERLPRIVLIDTPEAVEALSERNESFMKRFEFHIDLPVYNNDELVAFGKFYANLREYALDSMGELALYSAIGNKQTDYHTVDLGDVKEIIDEAIGRSEKRKVQKLFNSLFSKRYNEENHIILREKDFEE